MLLCGRNTAQQCRLGLFQHSDFAADLEDSKSTSGGILCIFGSLTFVPNKLAHSSTEADVISLDAGSRMDGDSRSRSLEFGYRSISFFTRPNQQNQRCERATGKPCRQILNQTCENKFQPTNTNLDLINIESRSSKRNTFLAPMPCCLSVFEDNEAVIKMMIKVRSPTMRHVSRTHRVALDWLFDKINFDSKNKIRYIDTKHQLADFLTKGNFTRDEWNNLLHLFNISHFNFHLLLSRIPA